MQSSSKELSTLVADRGIKKIPLANVVRLVAERSET